ncbi:hypothetical protein [Psychrilyobacter sp.]|uniref:hypothetical protein n=1 Tax=Psychrilyobacter sp. TaxID=2586924 RepID=UPI003018F880
MDRKLEKLVTNLGGEKEMKYFLFTDHPKSGLDTINQEKEERIRSYFSRIDTIDTVLTLKGKEYKTVIDYAMFANLTNFDCFNCLEHCCGDSPTIFNKKIRNFILENKESYNELTKTLDILEELGNDSNEIEDMIREEDVLIPSKYLGNEIDLCACAYTPKNGQTLCSLHSICLEKNMSPREIIENKPLICSIWPLEIILEEERNTLYLTLPDDFTNSFTIENFYTKSCINIDFAMSPIFRRENPNGFLEDDFKPFIVTYGETLKNILGKDIYNRIKNKLLEGKILANDDFVIETEQINRVLT